MNRLSQYLGVPEPVLKSWMQSDGFKREMQTRWNGLIVVMQDLDVIGSLEAIERIERLLDLSDAQMSRNMGLASTYISNMRRNRTRQEASEIMRKEALFDYLHYATSKTRGLIESIS